MNLEHWLDQRLSRGLALVPGVYVMSGSSFSLRPGGDASVDEMRRWARQELTTLPAGATEIRIIARDRSRSDQALVVESYDMATGATAAFRQRYRTKFLSKSARTDGPADVLPPPLALGEA